jgi:ribosomal-protein-alanine N-acetyltransferase
VDGVAWVRLFVYSGHWSPQNAWSMLWSTARAEIAAAGGAMVAAIAMQPWFRQVLAAGGFENHQQIVMLEWHGLDSQTRTVHQAAGIRIRAMQSSDLHAVTETDHASFDALWHNSTDTIERAYSQALYATVAESSDGIVGYQLTTGHQQRAHLARLAVHPRLQGRGVGRALLSDLYRRLTQAGIIRLSVNTQSDNSASLSLYKKMGFNRTGEEYPVYTVNVPAS